MVVNKKSNEYAKVISEIYDRTPKAVLAAIAVSYAMMVDDSVDYDGFEGVQEAILKEWGILHSNGIVPQKPIKS